MNIFVNRYVYLIILVSFFISSCIGTPQEISTQTPEIMPVQASVKTPCLHLGPGAFIVCNHMTITNPNQTSPNIPQTKNSQDAVTILQGVAESCAHVGDIVGEKDKKKKKRGFFRLLCTLFCTVINIIGNHKNVSKSLEQEQSPEEFEQYILGIEHITCDLVALINTEKWEEAETVLITLQKELEKVLEQKPLVKI